MSVVKTETGRTHFAFVSENQPHTIDSQTGIRIPDLTSSTTLSEMVAALHQPFINDKGETLPWIVAFTEALRVYLIELQFPLLDGFQDPDGRNDYCPAYSWYGAALLQKLGLPAKDVDVTNYSFSTPTFLELIDQAFMFATLPIPQVLFFRLCYNIMRTEESIQVLAEKILPPEVCNEMTPAQAHDLLHIATLLRSNRARLTEVEEFIRSRELVYTKYHIGHRVVAFLLAEKVYILDLNQDQNPEPELNLNADYEDYHHQKYGINPLRDSLYVAPLDQTTRAGYFAHAPEQVLSAEILESSSFFEEDLQELNQVFMLMQRGASIWDKTHTQSQTLRLTSTALIKSRRKLIGK